jgi:hypothetical protein
VTPLAVDALAAVRAAGGDVKLAGPGRLKVVASAPLPIDLIERLRAAKSELLALLSTAAKVTPDEVVPQGSAADWGEAEEERAAIVEFDGHAPRAWAEALTRLDPTNPPVGVPMARWQQFIDDCGRFLDSGWANRAEALGWGPLHLFGCDRERPLARYDHMGLLWIIQGRRLVALTADTATIDTLTGSLQNYRRVPINLNLAVLAWELPS